MKKIFINPHSQSTASQFLSSQLPLQSRVIRLHRASGFTLIELMVALVLGLIVTAAAVQLFVGGILSSRLQQSTAEIQDSGLFGLDYVVKDIRLANQGNITNLELNDRTPYGGIVLTGAVAPPPVTTPPTPVIPTNFVPKVGVSSYIDDALLSRGQGDPVSSTNNFWKGLTNVTLQDSATPPATIASPVSDQLTIQFVAPANMPNCEGVNVLAGDLVVQRYFLRPDANGAATDYALACDANTPAATASAVNARPDSTTEMLGLGDAGQIVIPRVDHFHVLFGVKTTTTTKVTDTSRVISTATSPPNPNTTITDRFAYYTIPQYRTAAAAARTGSTSTTSGTVTTDIKITARIVSVQTSILVRSANNAQNTAINPSQSHIMLDQIATPTSTARFQRRAYSTTVALRNAMGE